MEELSVKVNCTQTFREPLRNVPNIIFTSKPSTGRLMFSGSVHLFLKRNKIIHKSEYNQMTEKTKININCYKITNLVWILLSIN